MRDAESEFGMVEMQNMSTACANLAHNIRIILLRAAEREATVPLIILAQSLYYIVECTHSAVEIQLEAIALTHQMTHSGLALQRLPRTQLKVSTTDSMFQELAVWTATQCIV